MYQKKELQKQLLFNKQKRLSHFLPIIICVYLALYCNNTILYAARLAYMRLNKYIILPLFCP